MFRMIPRSVCPACLVDGEQKVICEVPYTELKPFLERSYVADSIKKYLLDILEYDYAIVECSHCSLLYQKNVPDSRSMNILYSELISSDETFERHRLCMDDLPYYERHALEVFSAFGHLRRHPSQIRALDFGAGWAQWARVAKAVGADVYISEISHKQIENAKCLGIDNIDIYSYSGPPFDYIHTQDVFEHLPDPNRILSKLSQLLRKDGLIRIAVPPGFSMKDRVARFAKTEIEKLPELAPLQHLNNFSQPSLVRFAAQFGLEPIFVKPKYATVSERIRSIAFRNEALLNRLLYSFMGKRVSPYPYFVSTGAPRS